MPDQRRMDSNKARRMDADLCSFGMRWKLEGDYLKCRKCNRAHLASCVNMAYKHAPDCPVKTIGDYPWRELVRLLSPLNELIAQGEKNGN